MVKTVRIEIPYRPRPLQAAIHEALDAHRFAVVVCHRRFGKTVMAVNHLIRAALSCTKERGRFAYIGPTYRQAKAIAWDYLKHYSDPVPGRAFNEAELRVDYPNGAQIRIYGADNPDALRGIYLDGVVPDEYGLMQGKVWTEVLRPALADRQGWAMFIGTPNGKNAFWELRDYAKRSDGWFVADYQASETGILPQSELDAARDAMTADEYAQEFECSFEASVRGAIYAAELAKAREDKRICRVPYDPILPVHTVWDLGVSDSTAIIFVQQHASEVRHIDFYEASGEGLPHYAAVLDKRGYKYGKHYAPHDINVRELGSGRSRIETARGLGLNFTTVPQAEIIDGIHAGRMLFPRCWFDEDKCRPLLDALQNYRWDWNSRLNEFKQGTPIHDWSSHAADAFRYEAMGLREVKKKSEIKYPRLTCA